MLLRVHKPFVLMILCVTHTMYGLLPFNSFGSDVSYADQVKNSKVRMQEFKVEQISFESRENEISPRKFVRKGFLMTRPHALGTIVFCHGYTHSKHESFFFKTFFPNFNALAFDFRAHGELTEGQCSTIGADEIYDVRAAVDFLKSRPDLRGKPIIGFGFSMGAVSLIQAEIRWPGLFEMLILDSPFDSSYDCMSKGLDKVMTFEILGRKYRIPGKKLIMKSLYNETLSPFMKYLFKLVSGFNPHQIPTKFSHVAPIEQAHKVKIPCLFFACVKDTKVPVEAVRRLYNAVDSPFKRMWITHGIQHCSAYLTNPELYWYRMNKFVKKVLNNDMKVSEKIVDDRVSISVV